VTSRVLDDDEGTAPCVCTGSSLLMLLVPAVDPAAAGLATLLLLDPAAAGLAALLLLDPADIVLALLVLAVRPAGVGSTTSSRVAAAALSRG
jgi:hypothetical protein